MRLALHFQILIALVVGAAIGLALNPGVSSLPDATVRLIEDDDGLRLSEVVDGEEIWSESFDDRDAWKERFPALEQDGDDEWTVSGRKVHFSDDGSTITVGYTRLFEGREVVTNFELETAKEDEFAEQFDWCADAFQEYAETTGRAVGVIANFVGGFFLRLLRMVTVPLIFTSLVTGVASLGTVGRLRTMFSRTILYYAATSLLAIFTGLMMVNLIGPGIGKRLPGGGAEGVVGEEETLGGIFTGLINKMVPTNPVEALAQADFLSIITFSILLGLFILKVGGQHGARLRELFQSAFEVIMAMTTFIIQLAPIGVLAFMTFATVSQGVGVFATLAGYMLTVFLALLFHATVVLPLILKFVARRSPIAYARAMSPALMTAFSTASSNGTLPLTMRCVEKEAEVSNDVSSFVLPLGATINMDGTALYEAVAVLFIAQAYNGAVPFESQLLVAVTALLASIGAAGIPHAGLVMMAIVLQAVGLPLEAQGIIIAVDRVLDMCRTSVNVWSDSCGCAVVERLTRQAS